MRYFTFNKMYFLLPQNLYFIKITIILLELSFRVGKKFNDGYWSLNQEVNKRNLNIVNSIFLYIFSDALLIKYF